MFLPHSVPDSGTLTFLFLSFPFTVSFHTFCIQLIFYQSDTRSCLFHKPVYISKFLLKNFCFLIIHLTYLRCTGFQYITNVPKSPCFVLLLHFPFSVFPSLPFFIHIKQSMPDLILFSISCPRCLASYSFMAFPFDSICTGIRYNADYILGPFGCFLSRSFVFAL